MRILAGLISITRFLVGSALVANPKLMEQAWIGTPGDGSPVPRCSPARWARATPRWAWRGIQATVRNDGSARQWLAAGAICDAVDFGATWAAGRKIPRKARTGILVIAAGGTLLSLIAAAGSGRNGHVEPLQTTHDFTEAGAVPASRRNRL